MMPSFHYTWLTPVSGISSSPRDRLEEEFHRARDELNQSIDELERSISGEENEENEDEGEEWEELEGIEEEEEEEEGHVPMQQEGHVAMQQEGHVRSEIMEQLSLEEIEDDAAEETFEERSRREMQKANELIQESLDEFQKTVATGDQNSVRDHDSSSSVSSPGHLTAGLDVDEESLGSSQLSEPPNVSRDQEDTTEEEEWEIKHFPGQDLPPPPPPQFEETPVPDIAADEVSADDELESDPSTESFERKVIRLEGILSRRKAFRMSDETIFSVDQDHVELESIRTVQSMPDLGVDLDLLPPPPEELSAEEAAEIEDFEEIERRIEQETLSEISSIQGSSSLLLEELSQLHLKAGCEDDTGDDTEVEDIPEDKAPQSKQEDNAPKHGDNVLQQEVITPHPKQDEVMKPLPKHEDEIMKPNRENSTRSRAMSDPGDVVMKPVKAPFTNSGLLSGAGGSSDGGSFVEELKRRTKHESMASDSGQSTISEKDSSSGYHEDFSDGREEEEDDDSTVPEVIMEPDNSTKSILKSTKSKDSGRCESLTDSRRSLSSTSSLPRQTRPSDDDVFETEKRTKGLNLPSENHVREAVFTKAIETAINPLAYGAALPNVFGLQSASIVLPSKKAISKASSQKYGYDSRRTNLEKVIARPHTEKEDMQWGKEDQREQDDQTRDEKVKKWSGTLRSSGGPKKKFRTKAYDEEDILAAISQQATAGRQAGCPYHAANPNALRPRCRPVTSVESDPLKPDHVREAVFTKAIETAINPLAYGAALPNVFGLQSAYIVLPSKKAISKASSQKYGYDSRRTNLEKVIARPHTEKEDMQWGKEDQREQDDQTRDEKVKKWSGTLRSSGGPKKKFRTKAYDEEDILAAISQQATAGRQAGCPYHAANPNAPVPSGNISGKRPTKARKPTTPRTTTRPRTTPTPRTAPRTVSKRPGTAPTTSSRVTPAARGTGASTQPATARPATARPAPSTRATPRAKRAPETQSSQARQCVTCCVEPPQRQSSVPLYKGGPKPIVQGSKAISVKPASHVSTPQEVMTPKPTSNSGPMGSKTAKNKIAVSKSTPIRRVGPSRNTTRQPLRLSNSLPRDKIKGAPSKDDLIS
eukprot:sb/3461383/